MGMTPWSAKGEGHDVEEELAGAGKGQEQGPSLENPVPHPTAEEASYSQLTPSIG